MKTYLFLTLILTLSSCINTKKEIVNTNLQVLPTFISQGDSITVYAIQDSIDIDTTDLFFQINFLSPESDRVKGFVKIKNGQGHFKVPKGVDYMYGFFYNLTEGWRNGKTYRRLIYNKNNKAINNNYPAKANKKWLEAEISKNPSNLFAYAKYIGYLSNEIYFGRVSDTNDTILKEEAKKYLAVVESKADLTKANDLYTLLILYTKSQQIQKAKQMLLKLAKNHPNTILFRNAKLSFWSANRGVQKRLTGVEELNLKDEDTFLDSLDKFIAQEYPYSSEGIWRSVGRYGGQKDKNYTSEQMVQNAYYWLKSKDSTDMHKLRCIIDMKLLSNDLDSAEILAKKHLQLIERKIWLHYSPQRKKNDKINSRHNINLSNAYRYLSKISEAKGDLESAINYMDNAYIELQKAGKNVIFFNNMLTSNQYKKARLQRKNKQPFAALKTYSELYQELKDERILDSIKLVFEEQDQIADYKNYIENLKNSTKEVKKELKITPEFSIKDTKGNLYTDKNLKGAVVILNFWGIHCSPCVREIPVMNEFWETTQGHEIIYLAITRDKALAVERFGRRQKEMFKFPVVASNQDFFDRFNIGLIPTQIIINPKGEIIYTQVGATQDATENLKKVLEKELQIDNILIE